MRRQEVGGARIDGGCVLLRPEFGIVLHRCEEAHGTIGVVAGARGDADADGVGFEFLRAREAGQRQLRLGERQRPHFRIADDVGDDAVHQGGLPRLFFADGGVAREHVTHLVGEDGGELGLVVGGERDEAAGHVELPGWQGEGVDRTAELSMVTR